MLTIRRFERKDLAMPMMTSYRHGVPAWVDVSSTDVEAAVEFYSAVFDWEATPDLGDSGGYRLFLQRGLRVAGIGPLTEGHASWTTYINVTDLDAVTDRVEPLGGTVVVAPMDIPNDSGRMSFALDPAGAFFGLFQAGPDHIGATVVNEPDALTWNELNVRDVATATGFYEALLGWTMAPVDAAEMEGYLLVNVEGRAVAGVMAMGDDIPADMPAHWATYFAVADLSDTVARCSAAGGTVVVPAFDTPVGQMAVLQDPGGATFAVAQFVAIDDPNDWPA
jgi:uncharacterized protein